jgi:hypothetical protein
MRADYELFVHWVPKAPSLDAFRVTNKNALPRVWLECFAIFLAYQDICQAAKNTKI